MAFLFGREVPRNTTDLIWDQDSDKFTEKTEVISNYLQHHSFPRQMISFVGMESSGKTTLINRYIGFQIINPMRTRCLVPLYLELHPADEFKIVYQDTFYNRDKISEFQTHLEAKINEMKQNIEERKPQYIHIYGPCYPDVTLVDLPGSMGKHSEQYQNINNHLQEHFGENNKIVLVHSINSPNGIDEVAECINNLYSDNDELLKTHIANKKIMCVATSMDKTFAHISDFNQKTFDQITNCEKRIGINNTSDTIIDHLPQVHCMLTVSLEDSSLGEEQNNKEQEFFDKTVEVYNLASESMSDLNKQKDIWISQMNNSGIQAFRDHIFEYMINRQYELVPHHEVKPVLLSSGSGGGGGGGAVTGDSESLFTQSEEHELEQHITEVTDLYLSLEGKFGNKITELIFTNVMMKMEKRDKIEDKYVTEEVTE